MIQQVEIFESREAMMQNYKVITLCGSTRFKEQFVEAQKRLTLDGCIVISVGLFGHSGDDDVWKPGVKEMLDDMHLRKIDMADEIYRTESTEHQPYRDDEVLVLYLWPGREEDKSPQHQHRGAAGLQRIVLRCQERRVVFHEAWTSEGESEAF